MNINDISTQLLYTTVPIYTRNNNGTSSSGTGFIFSIKESEVASIPLLITNYHVLEKIEMGFAEFHLTENGMPSAQSFRLQFDKNIISENKLGALDLIAIPLAATFNNLQNSKGIRAFFRSVDQNLIPSDEQVDDFAAIEDVTFIGYPNALYDEKNKIPIIRQGITATPIWNNFKGKEEFLIDARVFPGSSGSPVFIYNSGTYPTKTGIAVGNRLMFVGVVSSTMKSTNQNSANYLDLGLVINSKAMYRELSLFVKKLKNMDNH